MPVEIATWVVRAAAGYAAIGLVFAVPFVLVGARRIDPDAVGGSWGFRLLILPGAVVFWPLLLGRWLAGGGVPPVERNAHRAGGRR